MTSDKPNPRSGERGWKRPAEWAKPGPKTGSTTRKTRKTTTTSCLHCGATVEGKRSDRKYCDNRTCGQRFRRDIKAASARLAAEAAHT